MRVFLLSNVVFAERSLLEFRLRIQQYNRGAYGNSPYAQTTRTASPCTAGYSQPIADDRQLGLLKPATNPGLVPIPKELLNPPSDAQVSLIPLAPFITPSSQAGKDATGITFTDDRGQTITLDNSTTLSAQTLANLFNSGNSVVAQNFETTILNRLSNLR